MIHTITIPNWTPTPLNKLLGSHWRKASRMKQADAQMIGVYGHKAKVPKASVRRCVGLIITLPKGKRACDPDAYWKSLNDALVKLGYLVNDSHKWVEIEPVKFERGMVLSTTITLTDIPFFCVTHKGAINPYNEIVKGS